MADNWINVKTWPYLIFDKLSDAGVEIGRAHV